MSEQYIPFALTEGERNSALWQKLETKLHSRLEQLRLMNDGNQLESETALLRGRISEVKTLLALGKEPMIQD